MSSPVPNWELGVGPISCHAWNKDRTRKFLPFREHQNNFIFRIGCITIKQRNTHFWASRFRMEIVAHIKGTRFVDHWTGLVNTNIKFKKLLNLKQGPKHKPSGFLFPRQKCLCVDNGRRQEKLETWIGACSVQSSSNQRQVVTSRFIKFKVSSLVYCIHRKQVCCWNWCSAGSSLLLWSK